MISAVRLSVAVLLSASLALSCQKDRRPEVVAEETFVVRFVPGSGEDRTKVVSPSESGEKGIGHWALFVFNSAGTQLACDPVEMGSPSAVELSLPKGSYKVVAVANYPKSGSEALSLASVSSLSSLSSKAVSLSSNGTGALVMYGMKDITITGSGTQVVDVYRLVSRVGVTRIALAPGGPSTLYSSSFTIQRIYMSNVYRQGTYGSDVASPSAAASNWYNAMGVPGSDSGLNALLMDGGINATVSLSAPYATPHYFYPYPNRTAAGSDSRAAAWSVRCTRLVIEAKIGGDTYYYPVTIPAMQRNVSYNAEVSIKSYGSSDPELEVPGAVDVTFSSSVDGWDGPVNLNENS